MDNAGEQSNENKVFQKAMLDKIDGVVKILYSDPSAQKRGREAAQREKAARGIPTKYLIVYSDLPSLHCRLAVFSPQFSHWAEWINANVDWCAFDSDFKSGRWGYCIVGCSIMKTTG